jgi:hypothetical protein
MSTQDMGELALRAMQEIGAAQDFEQLGSCLEAWKLAVEAAPEGRRRDAVMAQIFDVWCERHDALLEKTP